MPLVIHALCAREGWSDRRLAREANISPREASLVQRPGHLTSLDKLERVANAFELTLGQLEDYARLVTLPADRSLTVCPPLTPLVLPRLPAPPLSPTASVPTG